MGLKEDLLAALTERIRLGGLLMDKNQSVSNEQEVDQLTNEYKEWDEVNKQILEKGFVIGQLRAVYAGTTTLGNSNEKRPFVAKREYLIKTLPIKVNHLKTALAHLQMCRNTDLGPIDSIQGIFENEVQPKTTMKKLFISHSSIDDIKIHPLLKLLKLIGVPETSTFYCSFEGYGLKPGENIIDGLKRELTNNDVFALFMLSDNFYNSPYCMCEMGAIWIQSHKQIPILIPPTDFTQMKGVFPNTIALKLDDKSNMNTLKHELEQYFEIPPMNMSIWEKYREDYVKELSSVL